MTVKAIFGDPTLDEEHWDAIRISAPAIVGEITGVAVQDKTTGLSYNYSDFPVSLPLGNIVAIMVVGRNTGTATQKMTITAELIDPDGIVRISETGTRVCAPNIPVYNPASKTTGLNKAGTWVIHGVLKGELA